MLIELPNLSIPSSEEIGARLQGFALAIAPAIAATYAAGYVTGEAFNRFKERFQ